MEITQLKPSIFRLKTKVASVELANTVKIETKNNTFVISEPGEYEVEGVSVFGTPQTYLIQAEGLRIVYCPGITSELAEAQVEELGRVDAIVVGVTDPKLIVKTVEAIEPTYILPYDSEGTASSFVSTYERGSREANSLSLSVATMPQDLTEVVVLK